MILGGYDLEKHARPNSTLTWHSISYFSNYWELSLDSLSVNNVPIFTDKQIIVDSGTSFILMPIDSLRTLLSSLPFIFIMDLLPFTPCSELDLLKFPDLVFTIDGFHYIIPRESYVMKEYGMCYVKIMSGKQ